MAWNLSFAFSKIVMVWLVALSLLLVGFAHRPALSSTAVAQEAYLASLGLSEGDLCVAPGESKPVAMGECPVCHLTSGMWLPEPVARLQDIETRVAAAVLIPARTRVFGRVYNPATPVRAPPLA